MDTHEPPIRHDRFTAGVSPAPDLEPPTEVAATAPTDATASNRPESPAGTVELTDGLPPGGLPVVDRTYGQMTKPIQEAPASRATRIVHYISSTSRDVSAGLTHSIRRNPLLVAVVGLGLAWLILRRSGRKRDATGAGRYANVNCLLGRMVSGGRLLRRSPAHARIGGQIDATATHLADVAGTGVRRFSQQAQLRSSQGWDRAEDLSGQIQGTLHELGDEAQDRVVELRHDIQSQVNRLVSR